LWADKQAGSNLPSSAAERSINSERAIRRLGKQQASKAATARQQASKQLRICAHRRQRLDLEPTQQRWDLPIWSRAAQDADRPGKASNAGFLRLQASNAVNKPGSDAAQEAGKQEQQASSKHQAGSSSKHQAGLLTVVVVWHREKHVVFVSRKFHNS
jgi:vacuolar-type H+-ATPase catalytic subunit A/Vma1